MLAYLGGAGKLVALDSAPSGADVVVVLGHDFQQVVDARPRRTPSRTRADRAGAQRPRPDHDHDRPAGEPGRLRCRSPGC